MKATIENVAPGDTLVSVRNPTSVWYNGRQVTVSRVDEKYGFLYFRDDNTNFEGSFSLMHICDFDIVTAGNKVDLVSIKKQIEREIETTKDQATSIQNKLNSLQEKLNCVTMCIGIVIERDK